MYAIDVFKGSDSAITRRYLLEIGASGGGGRVAAMLFRAQKASTRAKQYRGGIQTRSGQHRSFRDMAYDNKGKALANLCDVLLRDWPGDKWGWGRDLEMAAAPHVLYVDLPTGQVSFHSVGRFDGPDYPGQWDGAGGSEARILEFCDSVMEGARGLIAAPPF